MFAVSELNGLPFHPLVVHIPVVLVPLALIGALAAAVRATWRPWLLPLVTLATGVSLVAVQLAFGSGSELEDRLGESTLIDKHQDLATQTRPLVALFFLISIGALVAHRSALGDRGASSPRMARLGALVLPLCIATVALGAISTAWVARTGEAGSRATWEGEIGYSERAAGSDGEDKAATTTTTGAEGEPAGPVEVDIAGFAFAPPDVEIQVGDDVTWTNSDSALHNAEGREGPAEFTTEDLAAGDTDTVTFDEAGEYAYVCGFHDYMKGSIVVSE